MGRPPIPAAQRRTERVTINLTRAECDQLERAAGEQSPSDFVRALVLRSLERSRKRSGR